MLAKAIARVIQPLAKRSGGELPFATLNCSVDKSSANIFGGDIHTVGKGGGKLTRICGKFHANPAVIVIDEIDKCSPDALKGFYRVFDDGSEWLPLRAWCSSGLRFERCGVWPAPRIARPASAMTHCCATASSRSLAPCTRSSGQHWRRQRPARDRLLEAHFRAHMQLGAKAHPDSGR